MSTSTPCYTQLASCGPAVAWLTTSPAANTVRLCRTCLDWWFDQADDGHSDEPLAWGWLAPTEHTAPTREQLAATLTDPRNRVQVSEALRHEAVRNPGWLREFLWREQALSRSHNMRLALNC